ncbi:hypothetical protein AKJ66_00185 [candidate division MSBL1 archaeon SCGC-AAA259E22]|uniref:Uncharacterized protein n=1 Tax=candidate division MSBL1 archaeon SCGC-AAA259E22 TaxID=1698265 RepID=A0A133UIM1_9EURY|nr:hypothetical protein AKJ66_00185 [candidate division MSBL1 archaeon SCGC-AAA259E22]
MGLCSGVSREVPAGAPALRKNRNVSVFIYPVEIYEPAKAIKGSTSFSIARDLAGTPNHYYKSS